MTTIADRPTGDLITRRGVYHTGNGFAYVTFVDSDLVDEPCYIHPEADLKKLDYYCQDPGCRTVLELTFTKLYDGLGLLGVKPI